MRVFWRVLRQHLRAVATKGGYERLKVRSASPSEGFRCDGHIVSAVSVHVVLEVDETGTTMEQAIALSAAMNAALRDLTDLYYWDERPLFGSLPPGFVGAVYLAHQAAGEQLLLTPREDDREWLLRAGGHPVARVDLESPDQSVTAIRDWLRRMAGVARVQGFDAIARREIEELIDVVHRLVLDNTKLLERLDERQQVIDALHGQIDSLQAELRRERVSARRLGPMTRSVMSILSTAVVSFGSGYAGAAAVGAPTVAVHHDSAALRTIVDELPELQDQVASLLAVCEPGAVPETLDSVEGDGEL